MSRDQILERIRKGLRGRTPVNLPGLFPAFPSYRDPGRQFVLEATKVGAVCLDGSTTPLVQSALEKILRDTGSDRLVWENRRLFERYRIPVIPEESDCGERAVLYLSEHPGGRVEVPLRVRGRTPGEFDISEVSVGVCAAQKGIAETGSLVESTIDGAGRALPILPPAHVAFLSKGDIVMSQAEFFRSADLGVEESARIMITGPSRTADIEKQLVMGVHGPGRLFIVLTE